MLPDVAEIPILMTFDVLIWGYQDPKPTRGKRYGDEKAGILNSEFRFVQKYSILIPLMKMVLILPAWARCCSNSGLGIRPALHFTPSLANSSAASLSSNCSLVAVRVPSHRGHDSLHKAAKATSSCHCTAGASAVVQKFG